MAADEDEEDFPEEEDSFDKESLVGKKLSAKMTQWTIVLVRAVLLVSYSEMYTTRAMTHSHHIYRIVW